jgi:mono/diheme cytochrome c family protein
MLSLVVLPAEAQKHDQTPPSVRNPLEGVDIFRHYCATCHGVDARGHGPTSVALKHEVPDLTRISQRNGGEFPYKHVKQVIEGEDTELLSHGTREMPIWGPIFHEVEWDQDFGDVRLEAITKYIQSLQQK